MVNILSILNRRSRAVTQRRARRRPVPIPTGLPTTDAVFLVLRRMRTPLIVLITTFSIATLGMTFIPGTDADGNPYKLSAFDALYQMTMTVTTVGFTEAPYPFSYPQRMWMFGSIFMLVLSWAYTIGVIFAMMQDTAFQDALASQRFRRKVRAMREPFMLLVGYGVAGQAVGAELDKRRRRFVVVERTEDRVEALWTHELTADVPALEASGRTPAALGLAGLGHPSCEAVLALTDDDEANLAVVMSTSLLRPEMPVIARCTDPVIQPRMEDFGPTAIINPDDRYGGYLALSLHQPITHQLIQWLMDNDEHELPEASTGLTDGEWVVAGNCQFGEEVAADLRAAGLEVDLVDPTALPKSFDDVAGFVAASVNDLTNIALAEQVRLANSDVYLCVQQRTNAYAALLKAMEIDSIYISTELVAREVLARVLTPVFWQFLEQVMQQDERFAIALRDRLIERCGTRAPERDLIELVPQKAPAACEWIEHHTLRLGELFRHPEDRSQPLAVVPMMLIRDGSTTLIPDDDIELQIGDRILVCGTSRGLADGYDVLYHPATVEYLATGRQVPDTWLWRKITRYRAS